LRAVVLFLILAPTLQAGDWPQWLGVRRDGGTSESVHTWKNGEKLPIAWKASIPNGYSSPVVANGRVFLHTRGSDLEKEQEQVFAFDAETGKELWKDVYDRPAFKSNLGTGPRATPTVAGKRLFTIGINGVLSCYNVENGKRHWQIDLYKHFKVDLPSFAVCCSPLVVGNRVIVSVGGKGCCVVALNADTGKVEWQS